VVAFWTKLITWLFTTVAGKAVIKAAVPIVLLALFALGLFGAGLLPRSPFYYANMLLVGMAVDIPYTRYVGAFVPVLPILGTLRAWVSAIIAFHVVKFYLRAGKIIR